MRTNSRILLALTCVGAQLLCFGCSEDSGSAQVRPQPSGYKHTNGAAPTGVTSPQTTGGVPSK